MRTCNYDLSASNIEKGKYKVCLEYHIGNCKGPCEGLETLENYQEQVHAIREMLKGNFKVCAILSQKCTLFRATCSLKKRKKLKKKLNRSKIIRHVLRFLTQK